MCSSEVLILIFVSLTSMICSLTSFTKSATSSQLAPPVVAAPHLPHFFNVRAPANAPRNRYSLLVLPRLKWLRHQASNHPSDPFSRADDPSQITILYTYSHILTYPVPSPPAYVLSIPPQTTGHEL